MAKDNAVRIVAVGDVQPNRREPDTLFEKVKGDLEWGDLRYCQLECTLSDKGILRTDVRNPAHRVPPHNIEALTAAGFNVVSFAGNNNLDYGLEAFEDTLGLLSEHDIGYVGAGANLPEARRPLYTSINGTTVGWVNFCSILRDGFEATDHRPGISPLKLRTFYEPLENIYEQPGTPSRTVTLTDAEDLASAMKVVEEAKQKADVVIGCFHWGVHFTYDLAIYQADVAYAAIDHGCDLILGTHPHCLQAVDVYKGKHIFYSLGNFAFEQPEDIARVGVSQYLSFYGIPPEPELKVHPHPRHCRQSILLKILVADGRIDDVVLVPTYFNDQAQPEVQEYGSTIHTSIVQLMQRLCDEIGTVVSVTSSGDLTVSQGKDSIDTREYLRKRNNSYPWLRTLSMDPES